MVSKKVIVFGLVAILVLCYPAYAAQLGVNYYDETLMNTNTNGLAFIPRSLYQVGSDFNLIKNISNNVKLYMNPFIDANLPWVLQVNSAAKSRGMHTVVNMMVQFPQLDNSNWGDYSSRVVNACKALNGNADEILVGNEITLHSPLSRTDIKNKVVALMNQCKAVYGGLVSYEEFWYAKDVWVGFNQPLYFMMYEGLPSFTTNMNELGSKFGVNGRIGEWGEDLLDGNIQKDENWQKDQIQQRWNIIQKSPAPVAYIFTLREPSWTSFSMLRPGTDEKRPLWSVFSLSPPPPPPPPSPPSPPPPSPPPPPPSPPPPGSCFSGVNNAPATCTSTITQDTKSGNCRTLVCGSGSNSIKVLACDKPDSGTKLYFEMYQQSSSGLVPKVCFGKVCMQNEGFVKSPNFPICP